MPSNRSRPPAPQNSELEGAVLRQLQALVKAMSAIERTYKGLADIVRRSSDQIDAEYLACSDALAQLKSLTEQLVQERMDGADE